MTAADLAESRIEAFRSDALRLRSALGRAVVGQEHLIAQLVTALFAGGHVLLEGLPGLGKTHLAKGLARALGLPLSRVQCTPDLMPADITGSEVLVAGDGGHLQALSFRPGPVFAHFVLVDEINRAAPKTQAALLEAMQEGQVTHAGVSHRLPHPFWVIATQNPIEIEGTYPLPEAQLDRFLFMLTVASPSRDALLAMIEVSLDDEPSEHLERVLTPERFAEMMAQAQEVVVADRVKRAAVELVFATHPNGARTSRAAGTHVRFGSSPRGLQALLRAARVMALCEGRGHVSLADLENAALPALRHRVLLRVHSEMDGIRSDQVIQEILGEWKKNTR